ARAHSRVRPGVQAGALLSKVSRRVQARALRVAYAGPSMEPGKAAPERARTRSKKELDAEDIEVSSRVAEEFRLGPIEFVSRTMEVPSWLSTLGCVSIFLSVIAGLPTG